MAEATSGQVNPASVDVRFRLVGVNFDGFYFSMANEWKGLPIPLFKAMQKLGISALASVNAKVASPEQARPLSGTRVSALFELVGENAAGFSASHPAVWHNLPVEVFAILQDAGIELLQNLDAAIDGPAQG